MHLSKWLAAVELFVKSHRPGSELDFFKDHFRKLVQVLLFPHLYVGHFGFIRRQRRACKSSPKSPRFMQLFWLSVKGMHLLYSLELVLVRESYCRSLLHSRSGFASRIRCPCSNYCSAYNLYRQTFTPDLIIPAMKTTADRIRNI